MIAAGRPQSKASATCHSHDLLDAVKTILPQHPSDQHRPEQHSRRDDRLLSAIAGFGQVPLQAETINDEAAQRTWRGHGQRRWGDSCLRARISSSALAVSTSPTASRYFRAAPTRSRTRATHWFGIL